MKGIYLEFDVYDYSEVGEKELEALKTLGIKYELFQYKMRKKVRIVEDTATLNHEFCALKD